MATLRGWDLLRSILAREPFETPAVAFWKHHPVADQDARSLAEATLAFQRRVDCDFVKLTPASSYQLVDYGLRDQWIPDGIGRRTVTHRPVTVPDDWLRITARRPGAGFTGEILRAAALVRRALPREIPLVATIFNPVFQAVALAGERVFGAHRQTAADRVDQGLATLTRNTVALIGALRDAGVDGFYLASQHAGMPCSGDAACAAAMRGSLSIMHLHGEGVNLDAVPRGIDVLHYDCTLPGNPSVNAAMRRFRGIVASVEPPAPILAGGCAIPLAVPELELAARVERYRRS